MLIRVEKIGRDRVLWKTMRVETARQMADGPVDARRHGYVIAKTSQL